MPTTNNALDITASGLVSYDAAGTFSATTYAETTWTPTVDSSNADMSNQAYTQQIGLYQRIGNFVYIYGRLVFTATAGTGNLVVKGLPFTSRTVTNYTADMYCTIANITWPAARTYCLASINSNSTTVNLLAAGTAVATSPIATTTAGTIVFSGVYAI